MLVSIYTHAPTLLASAVGPAALFDKLKAWSLTIIIAGMGLLGVVAIAYGCVSIFGKLMGWQNFQQRSYFVAMALIVFGALGAGGSFYGLAQRFGEGVGENIAPVIEGGYIDFLTISNGVRCLVDSGLALVA